MNLRLIFAMLRFAITYVVVTYFFSWSLLCGLLVFWHPLAAVELYATLGFIAIIGTRTPLPTNFQQAANIWKNLMSGIRIRNPFSEARRRAQEADES